MADYFYSLQLLLSAYYARAGSRMREYELREAAARQAALDTEENQ